MTAELHSAVLEWFDRSARDLPWREPGTSPWGVLVSEVMLQQTPVTRVVPAYRRWMQRWPTPTSLALAPTGEAIRAWDRLGYPRRALRLHAAAIAIAQRHAGAVPTELTALLALPGVGEYTARAVASFAFAQRHAVVDTNVRRVVARAVHGQADGGAPSARRDLLMVEPIVPREAPTAARFAAGLMELGALVCTGRVPKCGECPLATTCAWRGAGFPASATRPRSQSWSGTDRQARGRVLALVRAATGPLPADAFAAVWPDPAQLARAISTLVADGLVTSTADGRYVLPG
ncbi:MAG TPA: A/G-specific adenine glycosylase [Mycobacteriales bacterium]|nr:A/G-specific adenine glycosylase [Mycobacteriales bacterium]